MSDPIIVHKWMESDNDFFARLDDVGGWKLGFKYINRRHDDERTCYFSNEYRRDGWNTTDFRADDYYRWKLSPQMIERIKWEARRDMARSVQSLIGENPIP